MDGGSFTHFIQKVVKCAELLVVKPVASFALTGNQCAVPQAAALLHDFGGLDSRLVVAGGFRV